ncbi:MAG: hypothetical protein FWF78_08115 [Defluviitaleaceae bacterium]|nr:hypothetical protein [Defluviitaleaceae bacterium]
MDISTTQREVHDLIKRTLNNESMEFDIGIFNADSENDSPTHVCIINAMRTEREHPDTEMIMRFISAYQSENYEGNPNGEVFSEMFVSNVEICNAEGLPQKIATLPLPLARILACALNADVKLKTLLSEKNFCNIGKDGSYRDITNEDRLYINEVYYELYATMARYIPLFGITMNARMGGAVITDAFYPNIDKINIAVDKNKKIDALANHLRSYIDTFLDDYLNEDERYNKELRDIKRKVIEKSIASFQLQLNEFAPGNWKVTINPEGKNSKESKKLRDILLLALKNLIISNAFGKSDTHPRYGDCPNHSLLKSHYKKIKKILKDEESIDLILMHKNDSGMAGKSRYTEVEIENRRRGANLNGWIYFHSLRDNGENCSFVNWKTILTG